MKRTQVTLNYNPAALSFKEGDRFTVRTERGVPDEIWTALHVSYDLGKTGAVEGGLAQFSVINYYED